jgi:hypothetical protein
MKPSARPVAPTVTRKIETDDHALASPASWPGEDPPTERHVRPPPASVRPPASGRPAAPDPFGADVEVESIAQTFDRLLASDLDAGFASISTPASPGGPARMPSAPPQSLDEVRALFAQLASDHVRPVRDFLIDLRWGEAGREWAPVCAPAVQSLRRAAEKLELPELITALDSFDAAMSEAARDAGPIIEGPPRGAAR